MTYLMQKQDGKYNPYFWLFLSATCLGMMVKEQRVPFSSQVLGKQWGTIYCKPCLSDHTSCPGKAAPALRYFPLIRSLLFQVLQDFLHLWNIWSNLGYYNYEAHTCYFCTGTLCQISPQMWPLQVFIIYEHHDICILIFSGCYCHYHYICQLPTSLVASVSFTLLPHSPKLLLLQTASNSLSITFLLLMNHPISLPLTLIFLCLIILQLIFDPYRLQRYSALGHWLDETLLSLPRNKEGSIQQFLAPGTGEANAWWKCCSAF